MTIRRDLTALESAGYAVRVHGGALNGPGATHTPQPSPDRSGGQRAELRAIAAAAAATVRPGMAIGLVAVRPPFPQVGAIFELYYDL